MRNLRVEEIQCKTILNKTPMPWVDYTLNAYAGCPFGCSYCYVPALRARYKQEDDTPWGRWVQVKVNAADVLRRQMLNLELTDSIGIGTASDSWQPLEKRYEISRAILKELTYYPNPINIVTRSPLLIRDIDLLQQIENLKVGVSIPTFREDVRRHFEPDAPAIPGRIALVKRLLEAGIRTSVYFAPILPGVMDSESAIEAYAREVANLSGASLVAFPMRYLDAVQPVHEELVAGWSESSGRSLQYGRTQELSAIVKQYAKRYSVPIAE